MAESVASDAPPTMLDRGTRRTETKAVDILRGTYDQHDPAGKVFTSYRLSGSAGVCAD